MPPPLISISIVSHAQGKLVAQLLDDLAKLPEAPSFELLLTKNIPEESSFLQADFGFPIKTLENTAPRGFGENHNAAFRHSSGQFFCVMNPDIRIASSPFPALLDCLADDNTGVVGPRILSPTGAIEDSVRQFPTLGNLIAKALGNHDGRYELSTNTETRHVDWIAGMFMLFKRNSFANIGGFDHGYFLYYEDVDICVRMWKSGKKVIVCPHAQAVHDARRSSRKNLRYLRWHIGSLLRYLRKHWLRLPGTVID